MSKKQYENKLAKNIKNDSKSFNACVRIEQNVCDRFGPLKHTVLTESYEMAQDWNEHFSSVFTRENTNTVSLIENRFKAKIQRT